MYTIVFIGFLENSYFTFVA